MQKIHIDSDFYISDENYIRLKNLGRSHGKDLSPEETFVEIIQGFGWYMILLKN